MSIEFEPSLILAFTSSMSLNSNWSSVICKPNRTSTRLDSNLMHLQHCHWLCYSSLLIYQILFSRLFAFFNIYNCTSFIFTLPYTSCLTISETSPEICRTLCLSNNKTLNHIITAVMFARTLLMTTVEKKEQVNIHIFHLFWFQWIKILCFVHWRHLDHC